MDRCISRQEAIAGSALNRLQFDNTPSPWDRFNVADNSSFTVRRRSTSPAASTFALSPLSSPCSSYHGDDLGSPEAGDDSGSNPVETLASLYINDTVRSRRSLGSNASSNRSSSSSGSAGSASSWTQQLPSFHRPLKFVSRPPDWAFAAVPQLASPGRPGDQAATPRGGIRRRNRRNPSVVVEDADKAAFEQLVGQRRVRKSFMFGKKNANSRQAIDSILANPDRPGAQEEKADLFWQDHARLPPVDYAQTVSARSAQGWQVAARLKAVAVLPQRDSQGKRSKDGGEPVSDGKESPVDVEMSSKPPSRESSFRGDDTETAAVEEAGGCGGTPTDGDTNHDDNGSAEGTALVKTEYNDGEIGGSNARAAASAPASGNVDSKKRIYGCTVPDCGKVYTKSSHLKSHMRSHTGKTDCSEFVFFCL